MTVLKSNRMIEYLENMFEKYSSIGILSNTFISIDAQEYINQLIQIAFSSTYMVKKM